MGVAPAAGTGLVVGVAGRRMFEVAYQQVPKRWRDCLPNQIEWVPLEVGASLQLLALRQAVAGQIQTARLDQGLLVAQAARLDQGVLVARLKVGVRRFLQLSWDLQIRPGGSGGRGNLGCCQTTYIS